MENLYGPRKRYTPARSGVSDTAGKRLPVSEVSRGENGIRGIWAEQYLLRERDGKFQRDLCLFHGCGLGGISARSAEADGNVPALSPLCGNVPEWVHF